MPPSNIMFNSGVYVDVEIEEETIPHDHTLNDFETAVNYAGNGKFQIFLLGVSGIIYTTCAISSTTLSFVLPSAKCDLHLSSADKGKLSATPLIGMLIGCTLWGYLADLHGRKVAIMLSLLMDFIAGIISSFASNLWMFLVCRFFSGFGIIGATSIIFSYLGEFISVKNRDRVLGRLEIFWNLGVILLPCVAWSLLNKKSLELFEDGGNFSPWRIFVFVCAIPSIFCCCLLYFLPEAPKYLMSQGKYEKAKEVFQKIYATNTGDYKENFPIQTLENVENINDFQSDEVYKRCDIKHILRNLYNLFKTLLAEQYLKFLVITSFADFGLMAGYYTLMIWFPEIFERFSQFESATVDSSTNHTYGVCVVSQINYFPSMNDLEEIQCIPTIEDKVFLDTLLVGLSCIPTSFSLSYFMHKIGKKNVLVFSLVIAGLSSLSLNFVANSTQTIILSCVFEALTSILEAVLFCVVVDLFPTNLRALALTVTATCGRLGAIFGNLTFGMLLDINCVIPVYLFGFLLVASGILCIAIPRNENYITLH